MKFCRLMLRATLSLTLLMSFATIGRASDLPLSVSVFAPREGVMVGEATVVTVRLTNRSHQTLYLTPASWGRGTVEFRGPSTNRTSEVGDEKVEEDNKYSDLGTLGRRIKPRQSISETYVLDRWSGWMPLTTPGRYLLDLHLSVPFKVGEAGMGKSYSYSATLSVPIRVLMLDKAQLRTKAVELKNRIAQRTGALAAVQNEFEVEALFSMDEAIAGPSWRSLITEPKPDSLSEQIRKHLRRIGSPFAANLLAEMWADEGSARRDFKAREDLLYLYSFGNKEVRAQIGKIFVAREGKLPEAIKLIIQPL